MKYAIAILIGIIASLSFLLFLSSNKVNDLEHQIIAANNQAQMLEQAIKTENEKLKNEIVKKTIQIKQLDRKHADDMRHARANFIAERLRLQADSESCRKESVSLSSAYADHARSTAETERLLLRTLDEAEAINAAYASCVMLIGKPF